MDDRQHELIIKKAPVTGEPDLEPLVFKVHPRYFETPQIDPPSHSPQIISRPGMPTKWRN
jgi:hypothetical protein